MHSITEHVYVEVGYNGSNNGVLDTGGGDLILVDAPQLPADALEWAGTVADLGTVRYLINTDHHLDHTVGNGWLGGLLVAHEGTRQRLAHDAPTREQLRSLFHTLGPNSVPLLDGYRPRLPEITFDRRLDLWLGDRRVALIHAPGHTANTIFVHLPDDGVLFTGDNVCEAGLPAFGDASVRDFFDAIDLATSLPFDYLVPGHGKVSGRDVLVGYRELGRALVRRVADAQARGASRAECAEEIRYEDRIHRNVDAHPDYPEAYIEQLQRSSIEKIYDDLAAHPELRHR